jgi:hypothetical protein
MFDAQIAATLLNRWHGTRASQEEPPSLELLREGKLHFKHEGGEVQTNGTPADPRLLIECLTFADGSRALRVAEANGKSGWTQWTAAEPLSGREQHPSPAAPRSGV